MKKFLLILAVTGTCFGFCAAAKSDAVVDDTTKTITVEEEATGLEAEAQIKN
jgi:hypothetical protein